MRSLKIIKIISIASLLIVLSSAIRSTFAIDFSSDFQIDQEFLDEVKKHLDSDSLIDDESQKKANNTITPSTSEQPKQSKSLGPNQERPLTAVPEKINKSISNQELGPRQLQGPSLLKIDSHKNKAIDRQPSTQGPSIIQKKSSPVPAISTPKKSVSTKLELIPGPIKENKTSTHNINQQIINQKPDTKPKEQPSLKSTKEVINIKSEQQKNITALTNKPDKNNQITPESIADKAKSSTQVPIKSSKSNKESVATQKNNNNKLKPKIDPNSKAVTSQINKKNPDANTKISIKQNDQIKVTTSPTEINKKPIEFQENIILEPRAVYDYRNKLISDNRENKDALSLLPDSTYSKMLFLAVSYNDSNAIKALLERGANINTIDSKSSYTPLMAAALECKINAVGYLLIRGANPNIKNKNGRTALHLSIINKCPEILKDLILAGANIDIKDHYGKKPLDYVNDEIIAKQIVQYFKNPNLAILSCSASAIKQCVKDAIDNGADINITDSEGNTPLMLATAAHSVDLVNLLINKGADTNKLNKKGQDALALAKKLNYWDIANIIETIKIKINFDQCEIIYYNDPPTEFNNKSGPLNKNESNFTKQPHKITKRKHSD